MSGSKSSGLKSAWCAAGLQLLESAGSVCSNCFVRIPSCSSKCRYGTAIAQRTKCLGGNGTLPRLTFFEHRNDLGSCRLDV